MKEIRVPGKMQEIGAAANIRAMAAFSAHSLSEYPTDSYWLAELDDDLRLMNDLWQIREGLVSRLNAFSRQLRRLKWRCDEAAGGYIIIRCSPARPVTLSEIDLKMARFYTSATNGTLAHDLSRSNHSPTERREREARVIQKHMCFCGLIVLGENGKFLYTAEGQEEPAA